MSSDKLTEALNTTREKLKAARAATGELLSAIEQTGGALNADAVLGWLRAPWNTSPSLCSYQVMQAHAARCQIIKAVVDEAVVQGATPEISGSTASVKRLAAELRDIIKPLLPPEPAEITIDQAVERLSGGSMSEFRAKYGELLHAIGLQRKYLENFSPQQPANAEQLVIDAVAKLRTPGVIGELFELREFKRKVLAATGGSQ